MSDTLGLALANRIIEAALAKGTEMGFQPLTVAVLDPGSHLVALARQDGSSVLRPQIAIAKAASALALGLSSRSIATMAAERPGFVAALSALAPQGMIPAAGGLMIKGATGAVIGAIGITGDNSDNDELCALYGLASVGLSAVN
jgi:uncharacterized protein GlcG (DUF336 family)